LRYVLFVNSARYVSDGVDLICFFAKLKFCAVEFGGVVYVGISLVLPVVLHVLLDSM